MVCLVKSGNIPCYRWRSFKVGVLPSEGVVRQQTNKGVHDEERDK